VVSSADTASGVLTTGTDGQLSVRGLADGTYTVKEIDNPLPGYAENFKAEFTVTVKDGVATINLDDDNNLVSENEDGQVEVLNVRSISELPLTGAAGTALFTVLGLLIAGAGTLVYMKSRSVKHMLRG
uniref:SpaA isopeptide-forming pilin-related protein n=1 Tax=Bifidobacterium pullorum TaxID=78448 RepID=UPI002431B076